MMMSTAVWVCLVVVAISVISDIATHRIPNLVTLGGLALGVVINGAAGFVEGGVGGSLRGIGAAFLGAILCGIVPFFAWKKGEMGGGDVKLFAAVGALMGLSVGFDVEARTFAFSFLVLFPYRLVRHRALGVAFTNLRIGIANLFRNKDVRQAYVTGPKLPPVILGPAIGVAFALTLVQHGVLR